ncbi:MAG: hypothetical protein AAB802_03515, partial [Patescibacteria group bacterium]
MAQFSYTAVNPGGKKLSGLIGAATEEEARKQLGTLGISILTIKQEAETPTQSQTNEVSPTSQLNKFEFEAFDKAGKKIVGTIPASSRYKAFQRLVEEYGFEVAYVVAAGANPEAREKAKHEDLTALKAEYETEVKDTGKKLEEVGETTAEFEKNRQLLLRKVDFILEKIKDILKTFDADLKPENRKIVQDMIDKLLRIKSSTNLDYIEHTSEELLKKVQDQELFLHKEKMAGAQSKVKFETQHLMSELHSRPGAAHNLSDDVEGIAGRLEGTHFKLLQGIAKEIKRRLPSPEEKELSNTLKAVKRQVWNFRKIWIMAPKVTRQDAYEALQKVVAEKNRIQAELAALKRKRHHKEKTTASLPDAVYRNEPLVLEEINHFLGWLLFFYLFVYFFSQYDLAKILPSGGLLPGDFNLLETQILPALLISVFFWYSLLYIKLLYFRQKKGSTPVIL